MKRIILGLVLVMLVTILLGCREPRGGGVGYQFLCQLDSIRRVCIDGTCTTIVRVEDDSFTIQGNVEFRLMNCVFVWINQEKNTIRLRRQSVSSEHTIISWKSLGWRKQE